MKLGAQGYTIRGFAKTPDEIKASFEKLKNIGYKAVQISGFGKIEPELLKSYADEYGLEITHFKDMVATPDNARAFAEIFNGNMNYDAIYNACVSKGVKWAVVEQDTCPGDPFDSLKLSFHNLKKLKFDNV